MKKYFQSSFTVDKGLTLGFAIPAMWGHYADKGTGMCIVFDKHKLLSKIDRTGFYHKKVNYSKKYDSSIIVKGNPKAFIADNIKEVFFIKSKDWAYEREYRLIRRSESGHSEIDISGCVMAVIVHRFSDIPHDECLFNSMEYRNVVNYTKKLGIPVLIFSRNILKRSLELTDSNDICWFSERNRQV